MRLAGANFLVVVTSYASTTTSIESLGLSTVAAALSSYRGEAHIEFQGAGARATRVCAVHAHSQKV